METTLSSVPASNDEIQNQNIPPFQLIHQNLYIYRKHEIEAEDETSICECKFNKEESSSACNEDKCINALLSTECTPAFCPCANNCQNQRFQQCKYAKLTVKEAEGRGWGLYADEDINAGQFVVEYCGEVIPDHEAHARAEKYANEGERNWYMLTLGGSEIIDATKCGAYARFINHSCEPNCETRKWKVLGEIRVGVFANKKIKKGSEITYDYNFEWFGGSKVKCLCKSKTCCGFLGAKSKAFQEDAYVWEDDDGRYETENLPTYDSDADNNLENDDNDKDDVDDDDNDNDENEDNDEWMQDDEDFQNILKSILSATEDQGIGMVQVSESDKSDTETDVYPSQQEGVSKIQDLVSVDEDVKSVFKSSADVDVSESKRLSQIKSRRKGFIRRIKITPRKRMQSQAQEKKTENKNKNENKTVSFPQTSGLESNSNSNSNTNLNSNVKAEEPSEKKSIRKSQILSKNQVDKKLLIQDSNAKSASIFVSKEKGVLNAQKRRKSTFSTSNQIPIDILNSDLISSHNDWLFRVKEVKEEVFHAKKLALDASKDFSNFCCKIRPSLENQPSEKPKKISHADVSDFMSRYTCHLATAFDHSFSILWNSMACNTSKNNNFSSPAQD